MNEFPSDIQFKYPWRKYQQRVLDALQDQIRDNHLHVIAPPGSGKTVLGLEVAVRLNKPTLIIAPSIAIRNQWVQRFAEMFTPDSITPEWISKDIRHPGFLTVITYQALHAAANHLTIEEVEAEEETAENEKEKSNGNNKFINEVATPLKQCGVKTVIMDEAHHLKNDWWQTLTLLNEQLQPVIVGLTATPPYDGTAQEWQRYISLNGLVDTEISVPELVIEGDLCPHQDYIYFTRPTPGEYLQIKNFRQQVSKLFGELLQDEILISAIENHPFCKSPMANQEWIYDNLSCYSSAIIYMNACNRPVTFEQLDIIGVIPKEIPAMDAGWMEILLDFYLFRDPENFTSFKEHQQSLENKLRHYGALESKRINLSRPRRIGSILTGSVSKLQGIEKIVEYEFKIMQHDLRMVILSDYIRKEFLVNDTVNDLELNKVGILPIFELLRRKYGVAIQLGVLTGSIIILPAAIKPLLEKKLSSNKISGIYYSTLPYDSAYVSIQLNETIKHEIVAIVTDLFQAGAIEVLIGTKSLLGEGWDAPAINSLILASFVGSFVLSNQMRGRAIRTQSGNPDKTGNIWHLVCVDPASKSGGDDLEIMERRFNSFVGISCSNDPVIENGSGRLDIPINITDPGVMELKNDSTFLLAGDRKTLKERWALALEKGYSLKEQIQIPYAEERPYHETLNMYWNKTIKYTVGALLSVLSAYVATMLEVSVRNLRYMHSLQDLYFILIFGGVIGLLIFGYRIIKTAKMYIKYRDISVDFAKIGNALLDTLIYTENITTPREKLSVSTAVEKTGAIFCNLEGGSTYEQSIFINSMKELIGPIENPRYVILRKSKILSLIHQTDFHSVPESIGRKKASAQYLERQWLKLVGDCELIYTHQVEGRKLLLRARVDSLAAQFDSGARQVSKWK